MTNMNETKSLSFGVNQPENDRANVTGSPKQGCQHPIDGPFFVHKKNYKKGKCFGYVGF